MQRAIGIVYDDAAMLIIDKPTGLVVHPAHGHHGDTVLDLLATDPRLRMPPGGRLTLVHRLDKDTSGLLVLARTLPAHRYLAYQWRRRFVDKRYLALVVGRLLPEMGVIDRALMRDPTDRTRMATAPEGVGQAAQTAYRTLATYRTGSLVELQPQTGRMHQLRAHLAAVGHPIAGDAVYGDARAPAALSRLFLHAYELTIRLPATQQMQTFRAPLPSELTAVLAALRPEIVRS